MSAVKPWAESSFGVAVAVNTPVNVGLVVGVELVPTLEAVLLAPGQLLDPGYHAPLMMTPSPLNMLRIASSGHELMIARMKHVGLGLEGRLSDEDAAAEPDVL